MSQDEEIGIEINNYHIETETKTNWKNIVSAFEEGM